jgi:tetratricopeptide (TPR) repeat protein
MTRYNRSRITARRLLAAGTIALLLAGPAVAADKKKPPDAKTIDHAREASACLTLAEKVPAKAFESALTWEERGGGDMAKLCQAMALFHQGQFQPAATRLEDLVPTLGAGNPQGAASLLARAGWAWLRAGDTTKAERAYTEALARSPADPELLIDRAFARAEDQRFWDAVDDLNRAIELNPRNVDAHVYRAGAYRELGNYAKALDDVGIALQLQPSNPEALLLRGNLRAMAGNPQGAREDWQMVTKVAPDTTGARAAADNLARMQARDAAPK